MNTDKNKRQERFCSSLLGCVAAQPQPNCASVANFSPHLRDSAVKRGDVELLAAVSACVRCARCKEVCPAYRATRDERKVARGRLMLLEEMLSGRLAPSPGIREILDACLKCHQCAYICPVGMDTVRLFRHGRSRLRGPGMRSLWTALLFRLVLPRRGLYNLLVRLARWVQKLLPGRPRRIRHLPLIFEGKRKVPGLAKRTALSELPESPPAGGKGPRVAFFLGCLLNYVYPGTAANAVGLIRRVGFEVVVPPGQLCCGLAALYMGDGKAAGRLARRNARILAASDAPYIVTACATCATMLKQEYPHIVGTGWHGGAQVMEICEFLAGQGYEPKGAGGPVTYHDPCHLRFAQRVIEAPRRLLASVGELREPAEAGRCCGGGGTFSIFHYQESREIGAREAALLGETGARVVATACPGCMAQLTDLAEPGVEVCHVVDFIARAIEQRNRVEIEDFVATVPQPAPS